MSSRSWEWIHFAQKQLACLVSGNRRNCTLCIACPGMSHSSTRGWLVSNDSHRNNSCALRDNRGKNRQDCKTQFQLLQLNEQQTWESTAVIVGMTIFKACGPRGLACNSERARGHGKFANNSQIGTCKQTKNARKKGGDAVLSNHWRPLQEQSTRGAWKTWSIVTGTLKNNGWL